MKNLIFLITMVVLLTTYNSFAQESNCYYEGGWHLWNEPIASSGIPADYTGRLEIFGTVTIDRHQYFRNCQIYMHPYSKIKVKEGHHLEIIEGTTIEACGDTMWLGIELNPSSQLSCNSSSVKDAFAAITAKDRSKMGVSNSIFDRNQVAIKIPGPQDGYKVILTVPLSGNSFLNTQPLKFPLIGGQTIGIDVKGGLTVSKENVFSGLYVGIIANCNYLSVEQSGFFDSNGNGETGVGISASDLSLTTRTCQFNNLYAAISAARCDGLIEANTVGDVIFGFAFKHALPRGRIAIRKNIKFNAAFKGILIEEANGLRSLEISGNKIKSVNSNAAFGFFGIEVASTTLDFINLAQIKKCLIDFDAPVGIGIFLNVCGNVTVDSCIINCITNTGTLMSGIELRGGSTNIIKNNAVNGLTTDVQAIWSRGIFVWNSKSNSFLCNLFNNTTEGMWVKGYSGISPLANNHFGTHYIGLHLDRQGQIGIQTHRFNQWEGNYSPGLGAKHDETANQFFVGLSRFIVHTTYSGFHPTPVRPNLSQDNVEWFTVQNIPIDILDCDGNISGFDNPDDSLFLAISDNDIYDEEGDEAQQFLARSHLYKYLKRYPDYYQDHSEFTTFYQSSSSSNIDKFFEVADGIESLFELPPSTKDSIEAGLDSLHGKLAEIDAHIILYDSLLPDSVVAWTQEFVQLQEDLVDINASIPVRCLVPFLTTDKTEEIEELETKNSDIEPVGDHEIFEKDINAIWLATVAQGNFDFSDGQLDTITMIANECPLTKGNAVFRARALYALAYPLHEPFTDDCDPPAPRIRAPFNQSTVQSITLDVSPNPAQHSISVVFDEPVSVEQTLLLTGITGNKLKSWNIAPGTKSVELEMSDVSRGIYFLSSSENGKAVFTRKLVLMK